MINPSWTVYATYQTRHYAQFEFSNKNSSSHVTSYSDLLAVVYRIIQ
jgi:hypothetical protein